VPALPVTVAGEPETEVPYPVVSPYSNVKLVEKLLALTFPFRVAVVAVTPVATEVEAEGWIHKVAKEISFPYPVPALFVA
jgi:hypothetical protein